MDSEAQTDLDPSFLLTEDRRPMPLCTVLFDLSNGFARPRLWKRWPVAHPKTPALMHRKRASHYRSESVGAEGSGQPVRVKARSPLQWRRGL